VRQQKKQREEALLAVKKQLSEAQYELTKAQVRAVLRPAEYSVVYSMRC
jgi:hypothetical protein